LVIGGPGDQHKEDSYIRMSTKEGMKSWFHPTVTLPSLCKVWPARN
jgi:hypothetical protein